MRASTPALWSMSIAGQLSAVSIVVKVRLTRNRSLSIRERTGMRQSREQVVLERLGLGSRNGDVEGLLRFSLASFLGAETTE